MNLGAFIIGFVTAAIVLFLRRHFGRDLSLSDVINVLNMKPLKGAPAPKKQTSESQEIVPVQAERGFELSQFEADDLSVSSETSQEDTEAFEAKPQIAEPLNMDEFGRKLTREADPIAELKAFVEEVRLTESLAGTELCDACEQAPVAQPDAFSLYLARGLEEAGLLDKKAKFPSLSVVRPSRSRSFFLRVDDTSIAWGDMLRIIAIEAALNRTLFAWEHLVWDAETDEEDTPEDAAKPALDTADQTPEPALDNGVQLEPALDTANQATEHVTLEEIYCFNQALAASITAQLGSEPIGHASMSDMFGEWGVRQALASGIESFRLPFRLSAKFRLNLMGGDVAIVANYVPATAQPASVYSDGVERIIGATKSMRERAATDYALRCVLLLASHAFRCSKRLCHAYVSLVMDTPTHHVCVVSGNISREALREYDLSKRFNARCVCRELGVRYELKDEALQEIEQGFSLDSEQFCPRSRYDAVDLSQRILPSFEAELLGATKVSDLAINENAHRDEVAQKLVRLLTGSVSHDVHRILEMTQNDKDESVQEAGRRLAAQLIDGTLSANDVYEITQDFVLGGEMPQACERAIELLNKNEAREAAEVLTDVLAPLDALDVYTDTEDVNWREFNSYVARALYNRLLAGEHAEVRLVPDAYYSAQLLQTTAQLALGNVEVALGFALRSQDLNPLDLSAVLRVVRCYELQGNLERASEEIIKYLDIAFDPNAIGTCYYRLAFMQWHLGNTRVADACYQKALASRAAGIGPAMLELQLMHAMTSQKPVKPQDVEKVLERAGIPLAPTDRVVNVLIEAAQASMDAEVFPVARSFASLLGALSGDDVMHGIANSIEREPDR